MVYMELVIYALVWFVSTNAQSDKTVVDVAQLSFQLCTKKLPNNYAKGFATIEF